VRLRTDDDVFRIRAIWLGPAGAPLPWHARYVAYGVWIAVFSATLLVKALAPMLSVGVPVWEAVVATLVTYLVMGYVDSDRTVRSLLQTGLAELRRTRPRKPTAQRVSTRRVRIQETP
jgi:uncharacterized membrane protein YcfT